jgi:SAM-dependent methyltransferase
VAGVTCPACGSFPRHRLLWLYLLRETPILFRRLRVLHFAPEHGIERRLERLRWLNYSSADLNPAWADLRVDMSDMPFPPESFDLVVCSHVLTYVADDRRALEELHRVLAPGGELLLLNPVDYRSPRPRPTSRSAARRIYGSDLSSRVGEAGFHVEVVPYIDSFRGDEIELCGLQTRSRAPATRADEIYHCSKA